MSDVSQKYTYEQLKEIADSILARTEQRPKLGIVCGSGLGGLADLLSDAEEMEYTSIPGFPTSTVKGHGGKLVFGKLEGVPCICMKGRFHYYEGYPMWKTVAPIQIMSLMGVKALIVTNAAGGMNPDFKAGDIMIIKDHINLVGITGENPLRGANDERFGPRFPACNQIYNKELQGILRKAANELGLQDHIKEGVYIFCAGPCYESPAELKFMKLMGADAVGMSTVPETIVASYCGMTVLGMSLITNKVVADVDSSEVPNHAEVLEMATKRGVDMQNLTRLIVRWGQHVWSEGMDG